MKNTGLMTYFLRHEFNDLFKKQNRLKISHRSKSILVTLYNLIKKADSQFHKSKTISIQSGLFEMKPKADILNIDNHIPKEILNKIRGSDRFQQNFTIKHNGDNYNVSFVYPILGTFDSKSVVQRFFQDCIYKIYLWLYVSDKFASKNCSNTMNLYFYFTDHVKLLASTDLEALDMIHVNTAFTSSCSKVTDICLFRREEWFKVFIHETFHNLGLDFSEMDCKTIDMRLNQMFQLNNTFKMYESYCETWAETIHFLFLSFFKGYDLKNAISNFETILHYESIHSAFQCVKILNHFHVRYDQLIDKTNGVSKAARLKYKELTPVFSYYVLKTIFLLSWNNFIEWCTLKNDNLLQFNKTLRSQMAFVDLMFQLHKSDRVLNVLRRIENWFHTKKNAGHDAHIMKNLRMTLLE
jgi:regulator of sigma D